MTSFAIRKNYDVKDCKCCNSLHRAFDTASFSFLLKFLCSGADDKLPNYSSLCLCGATRACRMVEDY